MARHPRSHSPSRRRREERRREPTPPGRRKLPLGGPELQHHLRHGHKRPKRRG